MMRAIKAKAFVGIIGLCFLIFSAFIFVGCSGGAYIGDVRTSAGAFAMRINWPDRMSNNEPAWYSNSRERFIPTGAQTIFISITGFGITPGLPITSSISYPQSSVLIENIPAGAKVATIQALSGTTVLSQRKESFVISNGKTEQAGNVALGIAVKQSGTDIFFEPTSLEVTAGADIPFQNWTSTSVTVTGEGINFALNAFSVDASGKITFNEDSIQPTTALSVGIQGYPAATCALNLPLDLKASIACGGQHTIALKENGEVWAWGNNNLGQLGDNSTTSYYSYPIRVKDENGIGFLTGVKLIAAGNNHGIALKENGEVLTWGLNTYGQLGDNSTTTRYYPIRVKGENGAGFLTGVKAIAGGVFHTIALKENGEVWAWGSNVSGQLGDNSTTSYYRYPIRVKGENGVGFLTGVKAIACGYSHSIALKQNGEVLAWGRNDYGQLGDNSSEASRSYYPVTVKGENGIGNLTGIKTIAAGNGGNHTIALKENGDVLTWGYNYSGQLGNNSTTSYYRYPIRVKGENGAGFLTGVKAIASGHSHSIAIEENGNIWAWGYNNAGQLGDNTSGTNRLCPVRVKSENGVGFLTGFIKIAGGAYHTIALKENGDVWAWGDNGSGQLGDNSTTPRLLPVKTLFP